MSKSLLTCAIVAAGLGAAQAANACSTIWISNATGSPPVVQGGTVQFVASGYSPRIDIYLDNTLTTSLLDLTDPPSTYFTGSSQISGVANGQHTLYSNWEACVISFSVVPVGAPGTPTLSSNLAHTQKGHPFILSWTVPSGTINHYTLSRSINSGPESYFVLATSPTSRSESPFVPPGEDYLYTYAIRACASSDESVCGAWSNVVNVDVYNPNVP